MQTLNRLLFYLAFFLINYFLLSSLLYSALTTALIFYFNGDLEPVIIAIQCFPRDVTFLLLLFRAGIRLARFMRHNQTMVDVWKDTVEAHRKKVAFLFEDESLTFEEVDQMSNGVAKFVHEKTSWQPNDCVALLMGNCPNYNCMWLGLAKANIVTSLINFNLRKQPLLHCIKCCNSKAVLVSAEFVDSVVEIIDELKEAGIDVYCIDEGQQSVHISTHKFKTMAMTRSTETVAYERPEKASRQTFIYIYTSGTTGLPKAAPISHGRYFLGSCAFASLLRQDDVVYCTLPLYHTAGNVLGVGQTITRGITVALRAKFSASNFWTDCIKYRCTAVQYIGEICRYLLSQPPRDTDRTHHVRVILGNGLRPAIWKQFVDRFNIAEVIEFYGSTEGNAIGVSINGPIGCVGHLCMFAPFLTPMRTVRVDSETNELLRDQTTGLAILCKPDEPGMLVGPIQDNHPTRAFGGYSDKEQTKKKIAHNVLSRGDKVFLTGDIMVIDKYGCMYFKDRTGDTFRWKGENVSTSEVEAVMSNVLDLADVIVYGVPVPGVEGKAGMATIADPDRQVDVLSADFVDNLRSTLPSYAIPMFIRLTDQCDLTGTFKLTKNKFREQAFKPDGIDQLFYWQKMKGRYVELSPAVYEDIINHQISF